MPKADEVAVGIVQVDWIEEEPNSYKGLMLYYGEDQEQLFISTSHDRQFDKDLEVINIFAQELGLILLSSSSVHDYMSAAGWVEEEG